MSHFNSQLSLLEPAAPANYNSNNNNNHHPDVILIIILILIIPLASPKKQYMHKLMR